MNTHSARSAMNNDPEIRAWVEEYLKNKERQAQPSMTDEELDKHWRYVKPERMHEGATDAVAAYYAR